MAAPNLADRYRETAPTPRTAPAEALPEPTQTDLAHWPASATLTPWIIPVSVSRTLPWRQPGRHISELIGSDETVILISFREALDWVGIRMGMDEAEKLGIPTMILGYGGEPNSLGALMYGSGNQSGLHDRKDHDNERAVFSPSSTLMRILGIDLRFGMRNSVMLIHHGKVVGSWIAMDSNGSRGHDLSGIRRAIEIGMVMPDDEITEIHDLD